MVSCKLCALILALVTLTGAASVEKSSDGDAKDDSSLEVLPMEKSPSTQPVEMSTTKSDVSPSVGTPLEPPGNPTWWKKTKAWFRKHSEAAKQWFAKVLGLKKDENGVIGTTETPPASSEADVPVAAKLEEPAAAKPGWWQKTKNWVSKRFGSKKGEGKVNEKKVEGGVKP